MRGKEVVFSSDKDDWQTPPELFQKYDDLYSFICDAAADETNHLCKLWMGPGSAVGFEDALAVDEWSARNWRNPPYSHWQKFAKKASEQALEGCLTVLLLPARTDTKAFHSFIYNKLNVRVEFLKSRVKFFVNGKEAPHGAPFPSMVVTFFPL